MKKKITIVLFIIVTILCIFLGIRTRYVSRLIITQLAVEGNGYVLKTSKDNLIIIDGGTENDADILRKIIAENGNNVLAWFITSPISTNTGALNDILENNPEVRINQIYSSLNTNDWYSKSNLETDETYHIESLMNLLYNEENANKYVDLQRKGRYAIDNYFVTPLEIRDSESNKISDQTVILKVDNGFKSAIFFGNIGKQESHYFYENNMDQLENDLIQISNNMEDSISPELFNSLKADKIMISEDIDFDTDAEIYKNDTESTVEIW